MCLDECYSYSSDENVHDVVVNGAGMFAGVLLLIYCLCTDALAHTHAVAAEGSALLPDNSELYIV